MRAPLLLLSLAALGTSLVPACKPARSPAPAGVSGVDEASLDRSADPCVDFYQFACGGWIKKTPIPEDRASWSRSFSEIDERNEKKLRQILEDYAAGKNATDPYAAKLGDFWGACIDEATVEKNGVEPLKPAFGVIDLLKDGGDLARVGRELWAMGLHPLFAFYSGQDFADATSVIGQLEQGGLGLPDRDYYFDKGKDADDLRAAYQAHVGKMLSLAGLDAASAATIMKLETELAKASMTRVDRREPKKVYHRMKLADVQALSPRFAFTAFVTGLGVSPDAPVNVQQPEFFKRFGELANGENTEFGVDAWKAYLKWHVVRERAPSLTKALVDEDFAFRSKWLTGAKQILPRWKRCVDASDAALGEALAIRFVKENFGADGKAKSSTLVAEIEQAMKRDLEALSWMDDATRKRALEKLYKIKNKIGYPDVWRKYDAVNVTRTSYAANVLAAEAFETHRQLAKIGKPLDRGEWYMTPPTVNAYYDANLNEMVFPAGILQPPFFDRVAADAVNYGAIGMVMGHELTHGFDDEGRQFDGDGNLKDWWTPKVGDDFEARKGCVVKQFDGYVALPDASGNHANDLHVQGALTIGENIADLGGLKLAYAAFQDQKKGRPSYELGGFTEEQMFFLGYAQGWCESSRPQYRAMLTKVDPHSPPKWRVNGPVSNLPQFVEAFSCKADAPMVRPPGTRCEIW